MQAAEQALAHSVLRHVGIDIPVGMPLPPLPPSLLARLPPEFHRIPAPSNAGRVAVVSLLSARLHVRRQSLGIKATQRFVVVCVLQPNEAGGLASAIRSAVGRSGARAGSFVEVQGTCAHVLFVLRRAKLRVRFGCLARGESGEPVFVSRFSVPLGSLPGQV